MNRLEVEGQVLERSPVRYTPAGIPILEFILSHESEVSEAGVPRRITFALQILVMGDLVQMAGTIGLGTTLRIQGFIAPVRKDSPKFRLHAQRIQLI